MSPELVAILGVGVALLGVGVALAAFMLHVVQGMEERLRQSIRESGERIRRDIYLSGERTRREIRGRGKRIRPRFSQFDEGFAGPVARVSDIEERLARIEGLLEGLRDTITGRQAA